MNTRKKYESAYDGYVFKEPVTYWTSDEEVKEKMTLINMKDPHPIPSGGMPIISDGRTVYADTSDGHTAVIASSGMKKSLCCFLPLIGVLAKAEENMILTDPKGELYSKIGGTLKKRGYTIFCLDFRTMDKDAFNILSYPASIYRNTDKDKGLCLLSDIISALAEKQNDQARDPFWPVTASQYLNATAAILFDAFPKEEYINVMNWSDFNTLDSAELFYNKILEKMPESAVKTSLRQLYSSANNTFRSILITASSFLSVFNQNPKLSAMLSQSTFELEDLTKKKTALFLITDDTVSTADPIIGILISQIQSYLIDTAYRSKNGALKTRMNFVLDEFASIPIPNMDKALSTHRSRNIRYYLCIQSLAMLKKRYGEPDMLLSNCSSLLYLGSTELELLQGLEKKLGETNFTLDEKNRPLCSQAELMNLKKSWFEKEAIYMKIYDNIRYCTALPSIERYDIIGEPPARGRRRSFKSAHYGVSKFVSDIEDEKIRVPFTPEQPAKAKEKKRYSYLYDNDTDKWGDISKLLSIWDDNEE